ncbi:MAG: hypothetical protein V3U88_12530 [Methylococcales bacterium]
MFLASNQDTTIIESGLVLVIAEILPMIISALLSKPNYYGVMSGYIQVLAFFSIKLA